MLRWRRFTVGLLKRLSDRLARAELESERTILESIERTVLEYGFSLNTEDGVALGEHRYEGCRYTTAGLWTCDMPEFIAYGPLDFPDNTVLWEVAAVYLNRGEQPRDGDRVQLENRVVTLRKVRSAAAIARNMRATCSVMMDTSLERYVGSLCPVFQIVGDLTPPVILYEGTPTQTRTVALEYEPKFDETMAISRRRRQESRGFPATTFDVAP
jgi:hypothetical protein